MKRMIEHLNIIVIIGIIIFLIPSCSQITEQDLAGLYEMSMLNIDGMDKQYQPEFIQLNADKTFAVSQVSGDFLGFYSLHGSILKFSSELGGRFNAKWKLTYFEDRLALQGLDEGFRVTNMTFDRITEVPSFSEFEDKIVGDWEVYKTRDHGDVTRLYQTFMHISDSVYSIKIENNIVETGSCIVNTRHHRINFVSDDILWNAWFYGEELRLTNPKTGFQYDLRKID